MPSLHAPPLRATPSPWTLSLKTLFSRTVLRLCCLLPAPPPLMWMFSAGPSPDLVPGPSLLLSRAGVDLVPGLGLSPPGRRAALVGGTQSPVLTPLFLSSSSFQVPGTLHPGACAVLTLPVGSSLLLCVSCAPYGLSLLQGRPLSPSACSCASRLANLPFGSRTRAMAWW